MNDFSHSWIVVGLLRLLSPLPGLKKGRRFGEGRDQDFLRSTCQSRPPHPGRAPPLPGGIKLPHSGPFEHLIFYESTCPS